MAENVPQSIEVPVGLSIFGSLVTEMAPPDLPEGVSPDNQDIVYLPGEVDSRPALNRLFAQLPNGVTVLYVKTFIQPNGDPLTLVLDSDGNLWQEDVFNNPLTLTLVGNVTPGSYCNSVTAFGKEYMAFHNNIHGTDIPRQFDGTFFDRVSQDGPGLSPTVQSVALPPSQLETNAINNVAIATVVPTNVQVIGGVNYYTQLLITTVVPHGFTNGEIVQIEGTTSSVYNGFSNLVIALDATRFFITFVQFVAGASNSTGGTIGPVGSTLIRNTNTVTAWTTTPHQLQVGFLAQITGVKNSVSPFTIPAITSIVINNESQPGLATVTTAAAHGLGPQNNINVYNVASIAVGGGISSATLAAQIATITTNTPHGLSAGSLVDINGNTEGVFNQRLITVISAPDAVTFTYFLVDTDIIGTGGTINYVWPLSGADPSTNFFQVQTSPTPTTFTVLINYSDGQWISGNIAFPWNGQFYVTKILSPISFQYQQFGPNDFSVNSGTVTPYGQIGPGLHQLTVLFLTRQGFVTSPAPPVQFMCPGGQYPQISNIPIGSPNVVARILAFTGAGGDSFFYLPVSAQINGILVSTSTQINDNTTTSVLVDFGDPSLFTGIGIDIPGNDLFSTGILGPSINVFNYASRMVWWGERNKVVNLINMGFDGGYQITAPNVPLGWAPQDVYGQLESSPLDSGGLAWRIGSLPGNKSGIIQQQIYQDYNGILILDGNTRYSFTCWAQTNSNTGSLVVTISSESTAFIMTVTIPVADITAAGGFVSADFDLPTPEIIPPDMVIQYYGFDLSVLGGFIFIDETELYPTEDPYLLLAQLSYPNNPETFDQIEGAIGPTDDVNPIMCAFEQRQALHFLTTGGLHETQDIAGSQPSGWGVREISLRCGAVSPRACDKGENFAIWVSSPVVEPGPGLGLYVFTGGSVYKVSQEIQPNFDSINQAAQSSICLKNDSVLRRTYVSVPVSGATGNNQVLVLDYRELDVASDLVNRPPVHISFTGKMICSDLSRKWTRWNMFVNCLDNLVRPNGVVEMCIGGGNGLAPGTGTGFGNVYYFNPNKYTDDDYGMFIPYYVTYFFINHEMESILQVGLHRKLYKRYAAYVSGIGQFSLTPYADNLANPYQSPPAWPLAATQLFDIGDGLNVSCERCAFKFGSIPFPGHTDNQFKLQKLIITLMQEPVSPIRFGAV